MAYTVKQVAAISGVSVRTLHFYDEADILKPAYVGANGYRFYEEPQLLNLQQILFYREMGFELKQIREILVRVDFEKIAALQSHRDVLVANLARTRTLIETVDRTVEHLKGKKAMKDEELFVGFSVAAGKDRFDEAVKLGGEPNCCKVSGRDTGGAMCVFEFSGSGGGPRHLHRDQDEWIYVVEGEYEFQIGDKRMRLTAAESIYIPRKTVHVWACVSGQPGKILNVYQPAGQMEDFFREVSRTEGLPTREDVLSNSYTEEQKVALHRLFSSHGMDLLGPPLVFG